MPYRQEAEAVLAMWRQVERDLEAADPFSDEAVRLVADSARLKHEYHRLIGLARKFRRPEPDGWPADKSDQR